MKVVESNVEIVNFNIDGISILKHIESLGRIAFKSEDKISDTSYIKFIQTILNKKHLSVLEHASISVIITCDRGISHELVRHRIASYTESSTRYCNFSNDKFGNEITCIMPSFLSRNNVNHEEIEEWYLAMQNAEKSYFKLINLGKKPQDARSVLPNSLKTDIAITTNLREWKYIMTLRSQPDCHPDMIVIMNMLIKKMKEYIPLVFDDIVTFNPDITIQEF